MRWAGCPGKRPRRGLKWELEKDRGAEAGWGSPGRGMKTGKARPISTRSSLVGGGLCAAERPRGWAAGSRPQPVRAPATTCPAPARRPPRTPELVLPIGGSETRWAGAPAAPPPSRGLGQPLLLPGPPSPHLSAGWPQARPRLRGRRGGGGGPPASAGNMWARRREAGGAPAPLPLAAVAPPTARFGAGPPAAPLSACRSPGTPRAVGPSLRVSPPRSAPRQVRGRAEGGRRRARAQGPRSRSRSTPLRAGGCWGTAWSRAHLTEWAGRPAGRGGPRWRGGGEAGGI